METNGGRAADARITYIAPLRKERVRDLLEQGASDREVAEPLFALLRDFQRIENRVAFQRGYFAGRRGTAPTEGRS